MHHEKCNDCNQVTMVVLICLFNNHKEKHYYELLGFQEQEKNDLLYCADWQIVTLSSPKGVGEITVIFDRVNSHTASHGEEK